MQKNYVKMIVYAIKYVYLSCKYKIYYVLYARLVIYKITNNCNI